MIKAYSAGFGAGGFAQIIINDVHQVIRKNSNGTLRGLHIMVIHPGTGDIETAQCFDTYTSSKYLDLFINKGVPDGYIVVAACQDECARSLSPVARYWFRGMGSEEIWDLQYRHSFAFIGISGRKEIMEKRSHMEKVVVPKVITLNPDFEKDLTEE